MIKSIAAGLAQSSHFTRNNRDEAVEIFAKWVPGTDVAIGKKAIKHIIFDPRVAERAACLRERRGRSAAQHAQGRGAARRAEPVPPEFMAEVEKEHPEYFADLPKLS